MNGRWPVYLTGCKVLPLLGVPLPPDLAPGVITQILYDTGWQWGDFKCGRHPAGCPDHWYLVEGGFAGDGDAFAEHDLISVEIPETIAGGEGA